MFVLNCVCCGCSTRLGPFSSVTCTFHVYTPSTFASDVQILLLKMMMSAGLWRCCERRAWQAWRPLLPAGSSATPMQLLSPSLPFPTPLYPSIPIPQVSHGRQLCIYVGCTVYMCSSADDCLRVSCACIAVHSSHDSRTCCQAKVLLHQRDDTSSSILQQCPLQAVILVVKALTTSASNAAAGTCPCMVIIQARTLMLSIKCVNSPYVPV